MAEAWLESRRGGTGFQLEFRLRPVGGDYRWFLARAVPVLDSTGRVSEWFGTSTDIHDQKIVEGLLRESRTMLQLVLDCIPQGVFWKDRESRILGCNRVVTDAMGLEHPSEMAGKTHAEWSSLRAGEIEQFVKVDREVMESDRPRADVGPRGRLFRRRAIAVQRRAGAVAECGAREGPTAVRFASDPRGIGRNADPPARVGLPPLRRRLKPISPWCRSPSDRRRARR